METGFLLFLAAATALFAAFVALHALLFPRQLRRRRWNEEGTRVMLAALRAVARRGRGLSAVAAVMYAGGAAGAALGDEALPWVIAAMLGLALGTWTALAVVTTRAVARDPEATARFVRR